jgi:PhnB protein
MPRQVQAIPKGYHSVTPYLVVDDAAKAIDFYQRAFGAKEIMRMATPNGKVSHAELQIGDSMIMLSEEMPGSGNKSPHTLGGSPAASFST